MINWTGVVLFVGVYALICARRLSWLRFDRPAVAMSGAVCCVLLKVLSPAEAIAAVNGPTILLLFGVMGMGAFLALDGFFDSLESVVVRFAGTRSRLLLCVVWGAGIMSAFITNDAVCVMAAPALVRLIRRHQLPALPFLLALATAANTGSVATLVGNPQNMLCAVLGQLSYRDYILVAGPLAIFCLGINHALLWVVFRKSIRGHRLQPQPVPQGSNGRSALTLTAVAATAVAFTLGADLAWTAAAGFVGLMLMHRRDTRQLWPRIDWPLLAFFAGLFIVVEGLVGSGAPGWLFERFPLSGACDDGALGWVRLSLVFLVGSNVVSNVPFILVIRDQMASLPSPVLGWQLLAMASTFAGNLTLLGSVANIIVAESAGQIGGIGFIDHLKVGFPLAIITTLAGTFWLLLF